MIIDTLENAKLYEGCLNGRIRTALEYLVGKDFSTLPVGRHEIDGKRIFALVQQYDTKAGQDGVWEAHRHYADVQFVATGIELLGYAPLGLLKTTQPYAEEKDCELLSGNGDFFALKAGGFAVFFPQDAHMPCRAAGAPSPVRKVVVKVAVA
jgi:YhcH/YjgK/YiaL family protein